MSKYRANATDIWKRPLEVRYIWFVEADNKIYTGATWNSFEKALDRGEHNIVKIIDVVDNDVTDLANDDIDTFKEHWRENYYNPDWKFTGVKLEK